ncbi:hypothetical protein AWB79_06100 [Caballeronia hypogeia]|uniref:Uncharacterized protein n=1 Tax=Caballeronia hypogeia TaxID=1777140 RepID=A0A158CWF5_9BURK|nr:hypothetical protein AWB79_06100 [Caballeronia hypogeia]
MRHVDHQIRADRLRDLPKALEVDLQRERGSARDDQLRFVLVGERFGRFVVDVFRFGQAIAHDVEPLARHVDGRAVREVAAVREAQAHDRVAGLEHREEHALVGLRAGVRLHVRGFGAEDLLHAIDGELLDHIDILAAAVVTLARIAFRILVGQLRALRGHDGGRRIVFRRDQLDVIFLTAVFIGDGGPEFRVDVFNGADCAIEHSGYPSRWDSNGSGRATLKASRQSPLHRIRTRPDRRIATCRWNGVHGASAKKRSKVRFAAKPSIP